MAEQAPDPAESDPPSPPAADATAPGAAAAAPDATAAAPDATPAAPDAAAPDAAAVDPLAALDAAADAAPTGAVPTADADSAAVDAADPATIDPDAAEAVEEPLVAGSAAPPPDSADALLASVLGEAGAAAPAPGSEQAAIDELLKQANFEDPSALPPENPAPDAEPFKLPNFQQVMADAQVSSIDLLRDVELNVKIELGRSRMLVEDVLKLGEGSVVELDKLAGDPVDVFVNDRLVARGEVLVLNDNFCVRVNEIVAGIKEEGM